MDNIGIEKVKTLITFEIFEDFPNSAVIKTRINKATGNICSVSCDTGEALSEKIIPYDTFIRIIDGKAEVVIGGAPKIMELASQILYRLIRQIV